MTILEPGQVWRYRTRAGEPTSRVIVQLVERDVERGEIVHIRVTNVVSPAPDHKISVIPHIPYSADALRRSLTALESSGQDVPSDFFEAHKWWRENEGGLHTLDLASLLDGIDELA